jgi:hypothetical protein
MPERHSLLVPEPANPIAVQILAEGLLHDALDTILRQQPDLTLVENDATVLVVYARENWRERMKPLLSEHTPAPAVVLLTAGGAADMSLAAVMDVQVCIDPEDPASELVEGIRRVGEGSFRSDVAISTIVELSGSEAFRPHPLVVEQNPFCAGLTFLEGR